MKTILEHSSLLASYLKLFPEVKRDTVIQKIMTVLTANYEMNTLGARMVNTLVHQYFIHGGIKEKEAKKVTFQKTLSLA